MRAIYVLFLISAAVIFGFSEKSAAAGCSDCTRLDPGTAVPASHAPSAYNSGTKWAVGNGCLHSGGAVGCPAVTASGEGACSAAMSSLGIPVSGYPSRYYIVSLDTTPGQYCWCRMTIPCAAGWVFHGDKLTAADCATGCASECAAAIRSDADFRGAVYTAPNS